MLGPERKKGCEKLTSLNFNEKKGFICDMDGVIYHGNRILPGVAEFIRWLHDEDKEYLFLTNNSGYTPRELNQKLARMGLDVPEEHFYTSALATAAFLKEQAPGCSVFVIGEAGLLNALLVEPLDELRHSGQNSVSMVDDSVHIADKALFLVKIHSLHLSVNLLYHSYFTIPTYPGIVKSARGPM